ncbi:hypothetical protein SCA6_005756 [Theobroma cacao]
MTSKYQLGENGFARDVGFIPTEGNELLSSGRDHLTNLVAEGVFQLSIYAKPSIFKKRKNCNLIQVRRNPMEHCQVIDKYQSVSNSGFLKPQIAHVAPRVC